jgi:hypothetical protein
MSLSHHSWRSPSGATADDRRFGAKTDRTRRVSRRINDHAPVAAHRTLSTRSRSTPQLFDLSGTTEIAQDHRKRHISRTHAVSVPHPLIKRLSAARPVRCSRSTCPTGHAARGGSRPPPVAWAPGSDGLVGTGVPPSRGRPSAHPRESVVLPTRPPCPRAGSWRAGGPHGRPGWCARQSGPGRERRAKPAMSDQLDLPDADSITSGAFR